MEIESSKRINESLRMLTLLQLIQAFKDPIKSGFTLNELKTEFHLRVKNRFYQYCKNLCLHNRYDESLSREIFQRTLIKATSKIDDYKIEDNVSENKKLNNLFAWLNKIAFRFFLDFLESRAKTRYSENTYEEAECEDPRPDSFEFDDDTSAIIVQEAWDDLDERERLIFYYCIEYNCLDNGSHLPDDAIDKICDKLKISRGNIRVIKNRALKRLRVKFKKASN
jgi:RNA polymerase sigma factor (sigma-70 family)